MRLGLASVSNLTLVGILAVIAPAFASPDTQDPAPATAAEAAQGDNASSPPPPLELPPGVSAGPVRAKLGAVAEIDVPQGFYFLDGESTRQFLEQNQNLTNGQEVGALRGDDFQVYFDFSPEGYVKDDEKDELDADAILASMRENNELSNTERTKRGWSTMELAGWSKPPFYDSVTNNLTWGILVKGASGSSTNWQVRMLGRRGVMEVNLVVDPAKADVAVASFDAIMKSFVFVEGERYAEFKAGDKVAEYGLTALMLGGAGFAAAKMGLFAKFWKVIVGAVVLLGAGIKSIWGKVAGRSDSSTPPQDS